MGYLYIFINDWMPKLVKIGITEDLEFVSNKVLAQVVMEHLYPVHILAIML
jgi:hypothetical protein